MTGAPRDKPSGEGKRSDVGRGHRRNTWQDTWNFNVAEWMRVYVRADLKPADTLLDLGYVMPGEGWRPRDFIASGRVLRTLECLWHLVVLLVGLIMTIAGVSVLVGVLVGAHSLDGLLPGLFLGVVGLLLFLPSQAKLRWMLRNFRKPRTTRG